LAKKHGAEVKNVEHNSPKLPLRRCKEEEEQSKTGAIRWRLGAKVLA
jgi:hypothetical protein